MVDSRLPMQGGENAIPGWETKIPYLYSIDQKKKVGAPKSDRSGWNLGLFA